MDLSTQKLDLSNQDQSLAALVLAVSDCPDLPTATRESLSAIAEQVEANPTVWDDYIAPDVAETLSAFPPLQTSFITYQQQIAAYTGWVQEVKQAFTAVENRLPALAGLVSRGFVPGAPSAANSVTEINNIAVRILTQPATVTQPEAKTDLFANLKARLRGNAS